MKLTLIMPIYNGDSVLEQVFERLEAQEDKQLVGEILLIDDKSSDSSLQLAQAYAKRSTYDVRVIDHHQNTGLAATYNEGMQSAETDHVVLMHQDILLTDPRSFAKIIEPFKDQEVVVSYPYFSYPYASWAKTAFWQKVLFSRDAGHRVGRFAGKFDCVDTRPGIFFDNRTYRTAGEDFDFQLRIRHHGRLAQRDVEVVHVASADPKFSIRKLLRKESQLAECYGVNLRRHLSETPPIDIIRVLIRPGALLALAVPVASIDKISALMLLVFSFMYTKLVYIKSYNDPRIVLVPFVNLATVLIYSYSLTLGFIRGVQKI
jgi:glycosyltransferase involved in cell wall biosynthesis